MSETDRIRRQFAPETGSMPRPDDIDSRLALGYGSAWHVLRCLGFHRQRFSEMVCAEIGAASIEWFDFVPCRSTKLYTTRQPIRERELVRLEFLKEDKEIQSQYNGFWPRTGEQQNWDAIGRAEYSGQQEWLLVEAKANIEEIVLKGTGAGVASREMIDKALNETKAALGIDAGKNWIDGYYQYANRLATLHFLNKNQRPARLLFLYFCGDQNPDATCPNTAEEWSAKLKDVESQLGLDTMTGPLQHRVHKMFLSVDAQIWRREGTP